ncbi:helix-turn-helix transcriptional regulator [Methylobacterium longum]|uniref:LuxR family transcriptional regulator n=1 Tax=Methylobacterium longum TaxID=767694 RepID=A0ABT8B092_9HYPH|nr:LuxR family transcriptional regulator [Methylobacterium longum]MDN3574934.1 LuxR family transcriptional regulator [Methylobacterium longum]
MLIGAPLLEVFDRMAIGGVLLAATGQVLAINETAQRTLQDHFNLSDPSKQLLDATKREFVGSLLRRCSGRVQRDCGDWIIIDRENKRPLILNLVALPGSADDGPDTVLMLLDPEIAPEGNSFALQRIFRLSPAEARLALSLASGATLAEAAEAYGVCVATARAQLKAVFQKTGARRQAELVLLISRLCSLSRAEAAPIMRAIRPRCAPARHPLHVSLM